MNLTPCGARTPMPPCVEKRIRSAAMSETPSSEFARALSLATIPEHSPVFMQIMSGGTPRLVDDFLFLEGKKQS